MNTGLTEDNYEALSRYRLDAFYDISFSFKEFYRDNVFWF